LQGEIRVSEGSPLKGTKVYLQRPEIKAAVDSTRTDSNGVFRFEKIAYGNYSIGIAIAEVDNAVADVISINALNPVKRNQHFKIDDGSLVCIESNYSSIKDALENKENVFILNLNNLRFDVAEKSLVIGTDGTKKLSTRIGEFPNLESLSMDINTIISLPAEMGNLKKLTLLSANLNKLSMLPAEMANLTNLKNLNLGKNNFQQFPELITKYTGLEVLNFENNSIPALPATINTLKNLKELNLANCYELTAFPEQLGELTNLEMLDISGCAKLRSLPEGIINLKKLKVLDVTGTKISTKKIQEAVPGCEVRK
jgi:Leucine-rich repeat (LRR) protein